MLGFARKHHQYCKISQSMHIVDYALNDNSLFCVLDNLDIIVFNFYPITPLMIILLAILNDMPIMTITYDSVRYTTLPERRNMCTSVLGIATTRSNRSRFYIYPSVIGKDIFQLNQYMLQSFIYLKLSVAGHLFLFVARTRDHFWSIKPGLPLFLAVVGTQIAKPS